MNPCHIHPRYWVKGDKITLNSQYDNTPVEIIIDGGNNTTGFAWHYSKESTLRGNGDSWMPDMRDLDMKGWTVTRARINPMEQFMREQCQKM